MVRCYCTECKHNDGDYCDLNDVVILTAYEMAKEALRMMAANEDDRK